MRIVRVLAAALLLPAVLLLVGSPAQAQSLIPADVTVAPAKGPAGSVVTISGSCGPGVSDNDIWIVALTGAVGSTSLGDPIITVAKGTDGNFSELAQVISDDDPSIPKAGDTVTITAECESYQGRTTKATTTFTVTASASCPADLPDSTESGDYPGVGKVWEGTNFVPDSPVIACMYSTPVLVGAATADENGDVAITIADSGLTGTHTFAVIGNDSETGEQVVVTTTVDLGPASAEASTPGSTLPAAGAGSTTTTAAAGLALLACGAVLLALTRRRAD